MKKMKEKSRNKRINEHGREAKQGKKVEAYFKS